VDDSAHSLEQHLVHSKPLPEGVELTLEQVRADLAAQQRPIRECQPNGAEQLEAMYACYKAVPVPDSGARHSIW